LELEANTLELVKLMDDPNTQEAERELIRRVTLDGLWASAVVYNPDWPTIEEEDE
jgi:hypothetical protein